MIALEVNNLSKQYGKIKALDSLDLKINSGEIFGILGPNGSGKTTFLGLILSILKPNGGSYTWFNNEYDPNPRKKIGSILETPNFYPYLNALENLEIVRRIKNAPKESFDDLLKKVNLHNRKYSPFSSYSLGMKQRLAIAATLIGSPDVLIFDEPTNGLDPQGIAEVRTILNSIAKDGKTVIMASHILDEVEKICSHVAIIRYGKLLASGPVSGILHDNKIVEISSENIDILRNFLGAFPRIKKIIDKGGYLECLVENTLTSEEINQKAWSAGIVLSHLVLRKSSLEEDFLEITKKTN